MDQIFNLLILNEEDTLYWKEQLGKHYADHTNDNESHKITDIHKKLAIKIIDNDLDFLKKVCPILYSLPTKISSPKNTPGDDESITPTHIRLAAIHSSGPETLAFISQYVNIHIEKHPSAQKNTKNCLAYAAAYNPNLSVIKYLVEECDSSPD